MPDDAAPIALAVVEPPEPRISNWLTLLLAGAAGAIAANIYYAQPLVGLIGPALGFGAETASLVVTLTQIGYCAGLILLVPLGDLIENRRLIATVLVAAAATLMIAANSPSAAMFLAASVLIGVSSVAVQMLVPLAAHLAPDRLRGQVVGNVMSGLLAGILLARPAASVMTDFFGWRAIFAVSSVLMAVLAVVLSRLLPRRYPVAAGTYRQLLLSLWSTLRDAPVLRRRVAYQASLFGAFSLFWTAVPLELASPSFGLTQSGIALFAFAGASGALIAPVAGRIADRGWTRPATGVGIAAAALSFVLARLGSSGSLAALVAAAILLDLGVMTNLVLGQRAIYALGFAARSRLNALFMTLMFAGGAVGSAIVGVVYARGGWLLVTWIGIAFSCVALLVYATEFLGRRGAARV